MLWRFGVLALGLSTVACGDEPEASGPAQPQMMLFPEDGAVDVSLGTRVQATIAREDAEACRFSMAKTTLRVTQNGQPVDGSRVFFIDGLRVDFTPSGLFEFGQTYTVSVETDCAEPASSTFTIENPPGNLPTVAAGDVMRITSLTISEPQAIADILRNFLDTADLVVKIMDLDHDAGTIRMLGAEGQPAVNVDTQAEANLRTINEGAFLFPMEGVLKWPYFQIEGSLGIPVDVPGQGESEILLPRFEISGLLFGDSPATEIPAGVLRAAAACADVCAVQDQDLQLVCANQSSICDEAGELNLIGSFVGEPNDLSLFQEFTDFGPKGAGVPVNTTISVIFTKAVDPAKPDAVMFEVTGPSGTVVAGSGGPDAGGSFGTFTPAADLQASTTYTVLAIAHDAIEWQFTTAP